MAVQKLKLAVVACVVVTLAGLIVALIAIRPAASLSKAADAATAPVQAMQTLQFSDGSAVELLGIQAEPFDGKWWNADGLEIPAPPHTDQPRIVMSGVAGTHTVRMMIRPAGAWRNDQNIKVQLVPSVRTGVSGFNAQGGRLFEAVALVGDEVKVADVQIGAANGVWKDDTTYDVASGQYSPQDASGIRVGNISEENGETRVEVQYPPNMSEWKGTSVVAMAGNQRLEILHGQEHGSALVCYFRCDKKDLTAIVSRSRDYEIKTIYNVPLSLLAPSPATAPGGK